MAAPLTRPSIAHTTTCKPALANRPDNFPRPPVRFPPSALLQPDPDTHQVRFRVCVCCGENTDPVDAGDGELAAGAFCLLAAPPETLSHSYCLRHLALQYQAMNNPLAWATLQADRAVYKHAMTALCLAHATAGTDPYGGWGRRPHHDNRQ